MATINHVIYFIQSQLRVAKANQDGMTSRKALYRYNLLLVCMICNDKRINSNQFRQFSVSVLYVSDSDEVQSSLTRTKTVVEWIKPSDSMLADPGVESRVEVNDH